MGKEWTAFLPREENEKTPRGCSREGGGEGWDGENYYGGGNACL